MEGGQRLCPGSRLRPGAPHYLLPSSSPGLSERGAWERGGPCSLQKNRGGPGSGGEPGGKEGEEEEGAGGGEWGWRAGQSNCVFVSSPVCTGGSGCVVVVGVASP